MASRFFVSPTRSGAARYKGAATRRAKRMLIPGYGKKGIGWVRHPKQAAYNKTRKSPAFRIFMALSK